MDISKNKIQVLNHVIGRLSLRAPQSESLARLVTAIEAAPELLDKERDLGAVLASLKAEFSTLEDFEREFPSLCFSLATGVGKTRLMGAFISYLHLAHGINNFFVLAPNLTIYNKLITDFTPNTPKYVFKGIGEFAINTPRVITGDNYDQQNISGGELFGEVRINIFNISKINSEVRGGKEPRIKRMKEVLGESYFNYLASLPDLVLLMDESHRYRASAGVRSINELNPLIGLEVTATPFVESTKGPIPFKNVVMDYPLARAMDDGFVKVPAVVTQRGFDSKAHSSEMVEKIKLEDGIRLHEATKVQLQTYARENGVKIVKPFILVIARDTTHASQLLDLMESERFFGQRYKGKVIQVDSSKSGADEEEMISRLLAVESVDEPTEIVIHVNMLKEGWDVTNLYTIVPLRAANARTLVEQSIGRGLRLPYGKRTGVEVVDRLNIVAHDKFQEIIDDCNRSDSPIRIKELILDAPQQDEGIASVQVEAGINVLLGVSNPITRGQASLTADGSYQRVVAPAPLFISDAEVNAAKVVLDVVREMESRRDLVPTSKALLSDEIQKQIISLVEERIKPAQATMLADDSPLDLADVVAKAMDAVVKNTIDIPRITVVPTGEVTTGFNPFTLDLGQLNLQLMDREMVIHNLHNNEQQAMSTDTGIREKRFEDYIVHALVDADEIDYFSHADLLYDLAGQAITHFKKKGYSEDELHNLLDTYRAIISKNILAQMRDHFWEKVASTEVKVSRGFTELKPSNYTILSTEPVTNFRNTVVERIKIRQMLFGGFGKCLYPLQKFDSDTERLFSIILERDAIKWFKPVKGQFQIFYKKNTDENEYIPDFVVELEQEYWMVEIKGKIDVENKIVQSKTASAYKWCEHASIYNKTHNSKPWRYIFIPHDEINESKRLVDYLRYHVVSDES